MEEMIWHWVIAGTRRERERESHVATRYSWDWNINVIDYKVVDRVWGERLVYVKVIPSASMSLSGLGE